MVMAAPATSMVVAVIMLLMSVASALSMVGPLRYNFYNSSCPKAEQVVRKTIEEIVFKDPTMGAAFLNMFFYDCFLQGCDASVLLDPLDDDVYEKRWKWAYLRAYDAVEEIKTTVEAVCHGVVSCTDIVALAARDDRFAMRGLDIKDMVVLSGAHSFGISHCVDIQYRLYPSTLYPAGDSTMNTTYAARVREVRFTAALVKMGNIRVLTGTQGGGMAIVLTLLMFFVAPGLSGTMATTGPLRYQFYNSSCPKAEEVVRKTTQQIISEDPSKGAAFVYLFYEDCFIVLVIHQSSCTTY
ncbi:hypothetical protein PR202_ga11167 [Eleusine coracana subsp. coracana]|uniref:Peroxidase n=1 Tax=Eleusine coracana subsp. coracana TaxID=191504 RepID=A0AAV5C8B2_ELECO|nr:hypothetical protein PR202_ga11167 [Eleusine coracana subsp. coracana]